ncbi:Hypothetical protein CINCED_3A002947 [Cinara cedri]|uniref:Uncharacterized protein n=1 Tax=Cinara cedri TaxID=506608 RepID=A0A5E4NSQ5_9HEMI|nr:Hypothetical protein CINCED_3A002947 [Cinara cedri]
MYTEDAELLTVARSGEQANSIFQMVADLTNLQPPLSECFSTSGCIYRQRKVNDNNLGVSFTAKAKFTDKIILIIKDSMSLLDQKLDYYFSSLDLKLFDWVRNPFNPSLETVHLSLKEEEELAELKSDHTL